VQIYPCLQNRKRCPLSSSEWKTIPWLTNPKSPKDKLLDILIELPGVLEDISTSETLSDQPEQRFVLLKRLEGKCWLYDRQLLSWATSCGADIISFVETLITVQNVKDESSGSALPSIDLAMAHLGLIYWTTYNLLSQILFWLTEACLSKEDKTQLPPHLDPNLYCRKVDLLIPYFKKRGVGSYFVSFIGFPVTVVASFLARHDTSGNLSEAREFLARALDGEHGILLKRFLATWPWMTRPESETLGFTETQPVAK